MRAVACSGQALSTPYPSFISPFSYTPTLARQGWHRVQPQTGARGSMYRLALTSRSRSLLSSLPYLCKTVSAAAPSITCHHLPAGLLMSALGRVLNSSLLRTTPMTM